MIKRLINAGILLVFSLVSSNLLAETLVPIIVGDITIFVPANNFEDKKLKAEFKYDARGRLVSVKDHTSQSVSYTYDDAGNRVKVNN
jgi:YD repeat-containing protein